MPALGPERIMLKIPARAYLSTVMVKTNRTVCARTHNQSDSKPSTSISASSATLEIPSRHTYMHPPPNTLHESRAGPTAPEHYFLLLDRRGGTTTKSSASLPSTPSCCSGYACCGRHRIRRGTRKVSSSARTMRGGDGGSVVLLARETGPVVVTCRGE